MNSQIKNKWIQHDTQQDVRLRLFCLPYAGGGSSIYRQWQQFMPKDIQVCKIQLPGRENRINEHAIDCMEELVQILSKQLSMYMDQPFALFGHSMGGMATYELARYLSKNTPYTPKHVFISGCRTPNVEDNNKTYYLQGEAFIDSLRQRGGTNEVLLNNKEYMQMVEPTLRADLKLIERWHHHEIEPLTCPLSVLGGVHDPLISPDKLTTWEEYTKGDFELKLFKGGHFFLNDESNNIASVIGNTLQQ
jgi:surfactin synthase thioesterase subunit